MGLISEFREFALKGNVVDLAVGVIIGAAFGNITTSLVNDIIMPPIGKVVGKMDFSNLYIPLYKIPEGQEWPKTLVEARKLGSVIAYGNFITVTLNFVIVAMAVFMVVKLMNMARRRFEKQQAAAPPPPPTKQEELLTEIRDVLKAQRAT
jgi:large conductance mechanosensitive channel